MRIRGWHGSSHGPVYRFDRGKTWRAFDGALAAKPVWLSEDPSFAALHATGRDGAVMLVEGRVRKVFPDAPLAVEGARYFTPAPLGQKILDDLVSGELKLEGAEGDEYEAAKVLQAIDAENYDTLETGAMLAWLKAHGYDAFWVRGDGPRNLAVMDPGKLRVVKVYRGHRGGPDLPGEGRP